MSQRTIFLQNTGLFYAERGGAVGYCGLLGPRVLYAYSCPCRSYHSALVTPKKKMLVSVLQLSISM